MGGVIVEDQLDGGVRGISCVEPLEEVDELPRPTAILDAGMHMAGEQVDPGEQAQRAMTLVVVVAREARMRMGGFGFLNCLSASLQLGFDAELLNYVMYFTDRLVVRLLKPTERAVFATVIWRLPTPQSPRLAPK